MKEKVPTMYEAYKGEERSWIRFRPGDIPKYGDKITSLGFTLKPVEFEEKEVPEPQIESSQTVQPKVPRRHEYTRVNVEARRRTVRVR